MPFNNLMKQRLESGQVIIGTWVAYVQTPGIVRMIAEAGFHFCVIDFQHSNLGIESVAAMCDLGRACNVAPIVRPSAVTHAEVNRIQDAGASGIMFPDVRSRAQVDDYLRWMNYPPVGDRGVGLVTSGADYSDDRGPEALARANDNMMVVVQVEHGDTVRDLDSLFAGGGIDMIEVGRNDLATSLGVPGEMWHPRMEEALRTIAETGARHGTTVGTGARNPEEAARLTGLGVKSFCIGSDRRVLGAYYRSTMAGLAELV